MFFRANLNMSPMYPHFIMPLACSKKIDSFSAGSSSSLLPTTPGRGRSKHRCLQRAFEEEKRSIEHTKESMFIGKNLGSSGSLWEYRIVCRRRLRLMISGVALFLRLFETSDRGQGIASSEAVERPAGFVIAVLPREDDANGYQ